MKSIFLFIVIFFSNSISILSQDLTQEYGGENAEWVYDYLIGGVTKVATVGDTIVGNRKVKILEKRAFRMDSFGFKFEFDLAPVYVSTKNGIVEFSTDLVNFDTLYNFQLSIGESWCIPRRDNSGELTGDVLNRTVVDTFSLLINEELIYCQAVLSLPKDFEGTNYPNWRRDTIYQNMGSTFRYILPFDAMLVAVDGGEGGILRCFNDDKVGLLNFEAAFLANDPPVLFSDFEYDCDQLSSIDNLTTEYSEVQISPNPASHFLDIQSEKDPIKQVSIFNFQGQLMIKRNVDAAQIELDISQLHEGIYFLNVDNRYTQKVIVLR